MKDSWDKVPGHSYESCKSPRQMERENEMIVISHRLKFESRDEWLETRDKTRRHQTSDFYPPIFGHRPIYIRGEAATRALSPSYQSTHSTFLPPSFGRRCPEGAEVGCVKRYFHMRGCQPRLASLVCPFQRKGRE